MHCHLTDIIREKNKDDIELNDPLSVLRAEGTNTTDDHVVAVKADHDIVTVGVCVPDRQGLLLDISKSLVRLNLTLRHTEASVVDQYSLSVWRCQSVDSAALDKEEIAFVLHVS